MYFSKLDDYHNTVMGFFDKIFKTEDRSEPDVAGYVKRYTDKFESLLDNNDAVLQSLNLPVPQRLTKFTYEVKREIGYDAYFTLIVRFPRFRLPTSASLRFRPELHCVWSGESEAFSHTLELLKNTEPYFLHSLIDYQFPKLGIRFGWTTQAPFDLYKKLDKQEVSLKFIPKDIPTITEWLERLYNLSQYKQLASIKAVFGLTVAEIKDYEDRINAFISLTKKHFYYGFGGTRLGYDGQLQNTSYLLPDFVLETFPSAYFDRYRDRENNLYFPPNYHFVTVVPDDHIKSVLMRQFFENLGNLKHPLIFSLCAANNAISFEIGYSGEDASLVGQQLALCFPGFTVTEFTPEEPEANNMHNHRTYHPAHAYESLKTMKDFHLDPYRQLCEALTEILDESLEARLEIWCKPFASNAAKSFLTLLEGRSFLRVHSSEYLLPSTERLHKIRLDVEKKIPGWWMNVNVKTTGDYEACESAQNKVLGILKNYETLDQQWTRTLKSEGSLVSLDELVSLAHFPTGELNSDLLEVGAMKQKLPPVLYAEGVNAIGKSEVRGKKQTIYLPEEVRDRHVYVVGKSGTGKSTLIETIARRDIEAGGGVAVIDPHGDLIRHLLESLPGDRIDDCVYFNPVTSPVSLEILAAGSEQEIDLLTDDLVTMFRRTSESWGDKMQAILHMTFQTLLRVPGSSFTDITRLLTDKHYRQQILARIDHPTLSSFWENRFDVRQAEPILIRMDRLTTSGTLRGTLTQHHNSLNFYDVIREKKIFLADLSKGHLGEATSHLLGSIIVSQIQLAVMRQAQLSDAARVPFSLFVDEVQNFTTGAFSTILSEARKYKLRLTIAHQFVSQLPQDIQKAVFGNVGTLVFFAMSPDDLGAARHELGSYEPSDVANLPKYHALCRPATAAKDTFPFATLPPPEIDPQEAEEKIAAVIGQTQMRFTPPAVPISSKPPEIADEMPITLPEAIPQTPEIVVPPPIIEKETTEAAELTERAAPEPQETIAPDLRVPSKEPAERDNSQHRYLQMLIKRIAESKGFQATIEKEVFGGAGRIDVALENETGRIAVEISVTNEPDYEIQNIRKCLAAGFAPVVMISADKRHLEKIERRAQAELSPEEFPKAEFFLPEAFHSWMENLETGPSEKEEKVKGFKVKVKLNPVDTTEQSTRKKAISDVVFGRLKTLKKDDSDK